MNGNGNGEVAQGEGLSDAPDSRRGEGHATLPSSTATDHATGISPWLGSWRRSLHRGSNSGSDAAVDRPDGALGLDARAELDAAHGLARDR